MASPATWHDYRGTIGDRSPLFAQLAAGYGVTRALYPGSYVDLSPSTAIAHVTYVDTDRRAARFFADDAVLREELAGRTGTTPPDVVFLHADYTEPLPLPEARFDLVISLYAGLVWERVRRHLRPGGLLLANNSHGDASIAALDPSLRLVAAVLADGPAYRLDTGRLDDWLVPRRGRVLDAEEVRRAGRGVAFTRSAFAYLFELAESAHPDA